PTKQVEVAATETEPKKMVDKAIVFSFAPGHQVAARNGDLVAYYTTTEDYVTTAAKCETVEGKSFPAREGFVTTERYVDINCGNLILPPNAPPPILPPPPEVTPPPTVE